jgi:large subunit ribosomal protein L25
MAGEHFALAVAKRTTKGRRLVRRARGEGMIPGVVYGRGQESVPINIEERVLNKAMESIAFHTHLIDLNVAGLPMRVLLKALQLHPVTSRVLHVDFHTVSKKDVVTRAVPLHFIGEDEAPGLKEGGVMEHHLTEVMIKCLPDNLPEAISIEVSAMALNDTLHMSDVVLPKDVAWAVDISGDHDHPVVGLHQMHVEVEEPESEAEEGGEESESDDQSDSSDSDKGGDAKEANESSESDK